MNPSNIPVPAKLSELIQLALDDIDKCEKDPRYEIKMNMWHSPVYGDNEDSTPRCCVCLAGAVMAQTHKLPINSGYVTLLQDREWYRAFLALDWVRQGRIRAAYIDFTGFHLPVDIDMCPYPGRDWRANAEWCRDELRKVGL